MMHMQLTITEQHHWHSMDDIISSKQQCKCFIKMICLFWLVHYVKITTVLVIAEKL